MTCRSYGTANPKGRKFCDSCGLPLAEPSASDPRSYTPKHLAAKILTSRSAPEGERKQVTVLFADVKGSMELAEHVDAEEWHKIMDGFFAILSEGVHRFEGTIYQYTGDGIMASSGRRSRTKTTCSARVTLLCIFNKGCGATRTRCVSRTPSIFPSGWDSFRGSRRRQDRR